MSGVCPTKYEVSEERGAKVFKSSKNLIECAGHHGNFSALRGVPYALKSQFQNTPLLDSRQECQHSVKNQILQEVTCTETHEFNPLKGNRQQDDKILATTTQTLKFKTQGQALPCCTAAQTGPRQPLTFDHSELQVEASNAGDAAARDNLRQLCQTSANAVRPETPALFTELIYNLRKMQQSAISTLETESRSGAAGCPEAARFFKDALPMCGSEACVGVLVDNLKKSGNHLSKIERQAWLMSLALVPRPSKAMVSAVSSLVDSVPAQGLLGLSSLVHGFCRHNTLCSEVPEVETFVQKLISKLGNKCSTRGQEEQENVILALKALGNVGHVRSAVSPIVGCAKHKSNPMAVRVAAVQALRRQPCKPQLTIPLLARVQDVDEDVELRLTSFLSLVRCPSAGILKQVVEQLESEPVNQVSSFIYSYLKAKQRTSSPQGTIISRLLRKHSLPRRFARDPLRFSNFYEMGQLMEAMNMGAHIEDAMIFVPKSSLPRAAFANLTVHLFGSSLNLLEVGGRFEGLDHAFGRLFGPSGYFSNPNEFYFQDDAAASSNNRIRQFQDLWTRRSPKQEKVSISAYMRVFGDELVAYTYNDPKIVDSVKELMNTNNVMEALRKLTKLSIKKNVLLMDSVLTVPTVSGLPLRLAVNASASLAFDIDSKAELKNVMKGQAELMGHLKPSAAIEIAASLGVQIRGYKSGARFITRLHSSTETKASITLKDGRIFKTKLELPQAKMEILDVQSQLFTVRNNVETAQAGVTGPRSNGVTRCSPTPLNKLTGLKLCGEMQIPGRMSRVPFVPLSGPMRTRITLEKDDATLSSYEFTAEASSVPEKMARVLFDTPGSTVDRKLEASVAMKPGKEMNAKLRYPGKEIAVTGTLEGAQNQQTGRLALTVDKKDKYTAEATVKMEAGGKFKVDAQIVRPNKQPVKMTGELSTALPRLAVIGQVDNLYNTPVEVKAIMEAKKAGGKNRYDMEAVLKCPAINIDLNYDVEMDGKYSGNSKANFRLSHKRPSDASAHVLAFTQTQEVMRKGPEYKAEASTSVTSSWYSDWDSSVDALFHTKADLVQTRLSIQHGPRKDSIVLAHTTRIQDNDKYTTEISAVAPRHHLDHKAVVEYQNRLPQSFQLNAQVDTPRMKGVKAAASFTNSGSGKMDMESSASMEWPGRKVELKHKLKETKRGEYKSDASLDWGKGKDIKVMSELKMKSGKGQKEYEIDSEATINGGQKYQLRKHYSASRSASNYAGWLKSGGRSLYDFKLNLVEESPKKNIFRSHLRSQAAQVNMEADGSMEQKRGSAQGQMTLKKDGKEFMKTEVVVPRGKQQTEKQLKAAVWWDMDKGKPNTKHLSAEYKLEAPAPRHRVHSLIAKADVNDGPQYDIHARVSKTGHYAMNITANRGDKTILDASVGIKKVGSYRRPAEIAFDAQIKSAAPLPDRNLGMLIAHKQNQKDFSSAGYIEDRAASKKYRYEAEYKQVQGKMVQYDLLLAAPTNQIKLKEELDFADLYDVSSLNGGRTDFQITLSGKKSSYNSDWSIRNRAFNYKSTIETPYKALSKAETEIEMGKGKIRLESAWNKNKRVELSAEATKLTADSADLTARVDSSFRGLSNLEGRVQYDFRQDWRLDSSLKWGEGQKIRFFHTSTESKVDVGFESKVAEKELEAKLTSEVDRAAGQYEASATLKNSPNTYKISGKVDTKAQKGNFEVQTPTQALAQVAVNVKKTGEGEYQIESERNGQANLVVRSILKMKPGDHRVKLQVEKIAAPFALDYEGKFSDRKWRMKAEATRNPSAPSPIVYGLYLSDEATSNKDRKVDLRIRHPSRQVNLKIASHIDLPKKTHIVAEITPDMGENRAPTKITATYERKNPKMAKGELKVEDPSLAQPLKAAYRIKKEGACKNRDQPCSLSAHLNIHYTADAAKTLGFKATLDRTPQQPTQRTSDGQTSMVTPIRVAVAMEVAHPATGLHAKLFGHRETEQCGEEICRSDIQIGTEFKDAQKQIKQATIQAVLDSYSRSASFKAETPDINMQVSPSSAPCFSLGKHRGSE